MAQAKSVAELTEYAAEPSRSRLTSARAASAITDQYRAVQTFQSRIPEEQLWWHYRSPTEFQDTIRRHLTQFVRDMLPELEKLVATATNRPSYKDATVRGWRDQVNRLAHAGFASLRRSYTVDDRVTSVQLGPRYDKMRFLECVSEFCSEIPPLLNAAEMYCRFRAISPADPGQWKTYQERVLDWQQNVYAPQLP